MSRSANEYVGREALEGLEPWDGGGGLLVQFH